jgi:hypothetical protein
VEEGVDVDAGWGLVDGGWFERLHEPRVRGTENSVAARKRRTGLLRRRRRMKRRRGEQGRMV